MRHRLPGSRIRRRGDRQLLPVSGARPPRSCAPRISDRHDLASAPEAGAAGPRRPAGVDTAKAGPWSQEPAPPEPLTMLDDVPPEAPRELCTTYLDPGGHLRRGRGTSRATPDPQKWPFLRGWRGGFMGVVPALGLLQPPQRGHNTRKAPGPIRRNGHFCGEQPARSRSQARGSSAQTCLWPSRTYQPCMLAISAIRYRPSPPSLGSRPTAGDGGTLAAWSETSMR